MWKVGLIGSVVEIVVRSRRKWIEGNARYFVTIAGSLGFGTLLGNWLWPSTHSATRCNLDEALVMWLESAWAWLYGNIVWLLPSGAIAAWAGRTGGALLLEVLRERRSANADRRKAATEFAHIADAYRRYWVTKHYDDLNAEPDTESFVQWSGDPFTPLVTPEHRALHARLPPALRDQAYTLDQKVKETKERIRGLAEFREEDIDIDAPILVAEIAIAADNLYRRVMRAAGLRPADEYDAISDIKGRLVRYRNDKEKSETANRRANAEMFGQNSG